jgi:2-succinyl-6-hydroxy-2,4-cyclohexadiene-1-carboxylate synthase
MNASATPVLLLHGFTGSGAAMAELARPLRAAGFTVLAPDLPGHGAAPVPEGGATMDAAVATALAALDRRGIASAHWIGYSMGGRLAAAAALAHPDRLASLVLIGASPGIEDEAEHRERQEADEALAWELEASGLAAFVDRWMAQPFFASQRRLGRRRLRLARADRLRGSAGGYAASLRGMGQGAQPSLWGRLGELRGPVLLVAGEEDGKYTAIARAMAERIPGARVEVVAEAGHAAHLEAPEAVGRAVVEFLRAVEL